MEINMKKYFRIITLAGLLNALKVVGKTKESVKIVTSGAGAAADDTTGAS